MIGLDRIDMIANRGAYCRHCERTPDVVRVKVDKSPAHDETHVEVTASCHGRTETRTFDVPRYLLAATAGDLVSYVLPRVQYWFSRSDRVL